MGLTRIASLTILIFLSSTAVLTQPITTRNAVSQLTSVAPSSTTCASSPFPSECATASTAIGPILSSFSTYSIATAAEQAALVSWMAFESRDFKYNINHYPGTPGQGTRCMLMPSYISKYVASIPALASKANGGSAADVLNLVLGDEYSFASAAWFYSSQCSSTVKSALQTGSEAGWEGFISGCVGTTVTDDRKAYWQRATAALGVATS